MKDVGHEPVHSGALSDTYNVLLSMLKLMAQLAESKYRNKLYNHLAKKKQQRSSITCLDFFTKIGFTKLLHLLEFARLSQKTQTPLLNPRTTLPK